MGLFESLKSSFGAGKLKKEQIERLREAIYNALADGVIDDRELAYINGFHKDSELSQDDFQKLCNEIFRDVVAQFIADRRVTANEINVLNNIINRLGITPDVEAWAQEKIQFYALMARIESGVPLETGNPTGLILLKGEECYFSIPATLYDERVVARNYTGGSQGLNIRIVKGVSYRVGQQKGQMVSQTGMVPISEGYFVITNKRLVFSGNRKSVVTPFDKLIDLHLYSNGLNYSSSQRQKPTIIMFSLPEIAEIAGLLISRIINES
jgi:hypothetical protein